MAEVYREKATDNDGDVINIRLRASGLSYEKVFSDGKCAEEKIVKI